MIVCCVQQRDRDNDHKEETKKRKRGLLKIESVDHLDWISSATTTGASATIVCDVLGDGGGDSVISVGGA